jgi:hypothetical protein
MWETVQQQQQRWFRSISGFAIEDLETIYVGGAVYDIGHVGAPQFWPRRPTVVMGDDEASQAFTSAKTEDAARSWWISVGFSRARRSAFSDSRRTARS